MKERDIPTTLMRAWIREVMLAAVLFNPAPDASPTEKEAIAALLADRTAINSTVLLNEAYRANATARLPPPMKVAVVNLRKYPGAYQALVDYLATYHPEYEFVDRITVGDTRPCVPVSSERYRLYTHIVHQGYK